MKNLLVKGNTNPHPATYGFSFSCCFPPPKRIARLVKWLLCSLEASSLSSTNDSLESNNTSYLPFCHDK